MFKTVSVAYVTLLTIIMGFALFSGAVVAPVIFNSDAFLGGALLSRFQEGLLMTEVFRRLCYPLVIMCLLSVMFEFAYTFKRKLDLIALICMVLMVCTGLLFAFYFVPHIIHMQNQGPLVTQTAQFASIHKLSEVCFKITVLSGICLAMRHVFKLSRG
ncbi:DUF4149 domain-containing protein [Vibrio rarus]|uniref:DUF4149 domain-containing protein n=1 Tax=Vibrio rarus TaxID=413403 RepID=UPI0021C494CE|nr:DUF4149 domain-containing protein [Vibrio rarus]